MKILLTALAVAAIAGPAAAQTEQQFSAFARDRNVSVLDRPHPEYAPYGLRWGNLVLEPQLDTSLSYEDNVFATTTASVGDVDIRFTPSVTLNSDWNGNALSAFVKGSYDQFLKYHSEDVPQVDLGANYRWDTLRNSYLSFAGEFADQVEPRTSTQSPNGLAKPLRYEMTQASVNSVTELNRLRYSFAGVYEGFNYQPGVLVGGGQLDKSTSDQILLDGSGKVEYAVKPGTAAYLYAGVNDRIYTHNLPTLSLDSRGFDVAVGTNFDITRLARGDVRIGYLTQYYSANITPVSGLSLKADVEYFPTQLTTVRLEALRAVQRTDVLAASSYLAQGASLEIDNELFRNVTLSGVGTIEQDTYSGSCNAPGCVFSRRDLQWSALLRANYQLNRRVGLRFEYTHQNLASTGQNGIAGYSADVLQIATVLRY